MIHDLLQENPDPDMHRDICIVGAGAAGIALAVECVRLGKSVFLLEGGGVRLEDHSQEPYQSEVAGHVHRGVHTGRFRALGGTTNKWGGQILELDPIDFEERSWIAESGWPFSKHHLEPFYANALRVEGLEDAIEDDQALWKRLGISMPCFPGTQSYVTRWTPEPNFARVHAETLEGPAVDLWLHANAVQILLLGETVQGIRCLTQPTPGHPQREAIFRATQYVFCLGAIESSRFFLQPRSDGGELPWNRSGLLGKHFQDHIDADAAVIIPKSPKLLHRAFDNIFLDGFKYHPKLRLNPGLQESNRILNAGATLNFISDIDETLGVIKTTAKHFLRRRFDELDAGQVLTMFKNSPLLARQAYRYAIQYRAFVPKSAQILLRVHSEQEPTSASSITLSDERDSLGLLRTRLDWRISHLELRTIQRFVQLISHAIDEIAVVQPAKELLGDDLTTFLPRCDDSSHHMGGMRMHPSPTQGVVDPDLQLNGTTNCFVLSSAVFPTSGFSNPTHTLLALAVRLAQHLDQRTEPEVQATYPAETVNTGSRILQASSS